MSFSPSLTVRDITPHDKPALTRMHARLSDETRYRRYHASKGDLTTGDLRYLTEVDGHRHMAVVAEDPTAPGELLGVARAVALDEAGREAELAIVVRDDVQHDGVGAVLVDALRRRAREEGIVELVAEVQADNHRALRFFQGQGARQRKAGWSGVYALIIPADPPPAD
ncbi:MAG: family N-acetyltransferase [Solirubrobacterales bacterium]|nr:family N-acetyltransferase [Solirubrobacterales bacterium]